MVRPLNNLLCLKQNVRALVQLGGLEPPTSCSTDRRSNQLSYNCILSRPPKKGAPNGAETRCNARLWQGRMGVNFSAVTGVVRAKAGTHTPRLIGKAMGPVAFVTIRACGYGSLLSQGRHHFYFWGRLATTKQKARAAARAFSQIAGSIRRR